MASIEEVRAGINAANDKANESLGALQQAHASLEQAQGELMRVTEGSGQADAIAVLKGRSEQHEESLVPRELLKASDETSRCSGLITGSAQILSDIQARL